MHHFYQQIYGSKGPNLQFYSHKIFTKNQFYYFYLILFNYWN